MPVYHAQIVLRKSVTHLKSISIHLLFSDNGAKTMLNPNLCSIMHITLYRSQFTVWELIPWPIIINPNLTFIQFREECNTEDFSTICMWTIHKLRAQLLEVYEDFFSLGGGALGMKSLMCFLSLGGCSAIYLSRSPKYISNARGKNMGMRKPNRLRVK